MDPHSGFVELTMPRRRVFGLHAQWRVRVTPGLAIDMGTGVDFAVFGMEETRILRFPIAIAAYRRGRSTASPAVGLLLKHACLRHPGCIRRIYSRPFLFPGNRHGYRLRRMTGGWMKATTGFPVRRG